MIDNGLKMGKSERWVWNAHRKAQDWYGALSVFLPYFLIDNITRTPFILLLVPIIDANGGVIENIMGVAFVMMSCYLSSK